ncbi:MAG: NIL domain-containing protein, partial [Rhodococcus sp. (in: high G+C Gram-positive bacteria)]|nr:NIL domain-containing protein [Rhodococcus sp. (in: high G+C Gram-positive bacteria)]MDX5451951.1 NIL domain-containing protein [Rhodococcus sp. (in: high G+C Gram-positive bacteria)]
DLVADPGSRLGDALLPAGVGEQNGDVTALVTARGSAVATPWLSRLSRDVGIDVAVVGGRVDRVAGTDIGKLHVRFDGDVDRDAVDRFFATLPDVTVAWTTGAVARVGA